MIFVHVLSPCPCLPIAGCPSILESQGVVDLCFLRSTKSQRWNDTIAHDVRIYLDDFLWCWTNLDDFMALCVCFQFFFICDAWSSFIAWRSKLGSIKITFCSRHPVYHGCVHALHLVFLGLFTVICYFHLFSPLYKPSFWDDLAKV